MPEKPNKKIVNSNAISMITSVAGIKQEVNFQFAFRSIQFKMKKHKSQFHFRHSAIQS